MDYFEEILRDIQSGEISNTKELQKAKMNYCKKYGIAELPSNADILEKVENFKDIKKDEVLDVLQRKPSRKKSGVTVIAVMTSPAECPHGRCIMCPGGPFDEEPSPQSYTGKEPAALRGERNDFDPKKQVLDRLQQYRAIGHTTDKVDLIIMGGTFPARDWDYQKEFTKGCYDGLNGKPAKTLKEAKKINENTDIRCIGLTIETRPDYCKGNELDRMLELGATRVELGVQTLSDEVLDAINRGHTVQDTVEATRLAKNRGLKVCYHMMPGLPGTTPEKDLENFKKLFDDQRFQPDMLKIYPTLVIEGTELYDMWKDGEYEPLSTNEAAESVAQMKDIVPPYVRIQRVQRDVPSPLVDAGVKKSNLRQYAKRAMHEKGLSCDCIRCREVGHSEEDVDRSNIGLTKIEYEASGGIEHFLELGENGIIVGYARLRTSDEHIPILRELKVVGNMTPVSETGQKNGFQHTGFGRSLVKECEQISRQFDDSLKVISGIGAREYYRKLGYKLDEPYMVKLL
ncbi:MAG: tRNA uridine(34) 5-carboxymethylaminomethyl modification radical SAM/GNAT enzyme Elp3 [Thermoplasmatota archaeon]